MRKHVEALLNVPRSVVKGLRITLRNLARPKTTKMYPEEYPVPAGQGPRPDPQRPFEVPYEIAPRYRGLHGLTRDPVTGDLNCIGCMACARVCPDDLISMDLEKREGHNGRYPVTFSVNIGPCCFCGLCAEVCPTPMRAIVMTDLFEWAVYERDGQNLVLGIDDLLRNGEYEVARRAAGRQWSEDGELVGINPEEEGNPYFQFAPESGKADRMPKPAERAEPAERTETAAPPAPEPGAATAAVTETPLDALRAAFAEAGIPVPADLDAFDAAVLDAIEDRRLRGRCKSALAKARKAGAEAAVEAPPAEPSEPVSAPPTADPAAALRAELAALLAEAGIAAPEDPAAVDAAALDGIEDRALRGRLKSTLRKLQRALGGEE